MSAETIGSGGAVTSYKDKSVTGACQLFLGEFKEGLLRTYLSERRPASPLLSEVVDLALAFTAYTYDTVDKAELDNGVHRFVEKIETETRTIDVVLGYRERNKVAWMLLRGLSSTVSFILH